jgi:hypothetical protein
MLKPANVSLDPPRGKRDVARNLLTGIFVIASLFDVGLGSDGRGSARCLHFFLLCDGGLLRATSTNEQ